MLAGIAAFLLSSAHPAHLIYWCKTDGTSTEFSLAYDVRGTKIRNVLVADRNSPRLPPDWATKWTARPSGQGVSFRFRHVVDGLGISGAMELTPEAGPRGRFRLKWSSISGLGSHVPLEEERSAECVLAGSEAAAEQRR